MPGLQASRRATVWWVCYGDTAETATFRFRQPVDEAVARKRARQHRELSSLPRGTLVWPDPDHLVKGQGHR